MRIQTCLFLWGAVLAVGAVASTSPMLHELVVPEGFSLREVTDKRGQALISRMNTLEWRNDSGVFIWLRIDDSQPITNEKISVHAVSIVRSMRDQARSHTTANTARHDVSGKAWVLLPMKAKDPSNAPDMLVLITELSGMVAYIQVGGKREVWEEAKKVTADVMRLNSPPEAAVTPAKGSSR